MKLSDKWKELTESQQNQEEEVKFWEGYLKKEAGIYKNILASKENLVEGKLSDLAKKYDIEEAYLVGFVDGINESLKSEIELDELESDTNLKLEIDFEKLYYNMVAVEAHWLYNLDEWKEILSEDTRKSIQKEYKSSKTIVKGDKVGRNEVCPCGSGKKYKKCCGK